MGENMNETTAPKPVARRIGNGAGRVIVGIARSVTFDPIKGTATFHGLTGGATVAVRGRSFAGNVSLTATETSALLADLGIAEVPATMVRDSKPWRSFAASIATAGMRGFRVTLPDVPKPPRKRRDGAPAIDPKDAAVAAVLASLNG